MYDITIIGAGVIGSAIARELSRYQLKILLLEKEEDVSNGASKANSGIVHGGFDAKHGTMKSKFSRAGNRMYAQLEAELHFGYKECGGLVLAFSTADFSTLEKLKINGEKNGVDDLEIIDQKAVRALEPHINQAVVGALHCPSIGITSPYELTIALAESAVSNGVELKLNEQVTAIDPGEHFIVHTQNNRYETKYIINAAGVYSDIVAGMVGLDDFHILPRRGEYVLLNKDQGHLANTVLFQCPTEKGKGILVTQTYHGNLMLGPNAQEVHDPAEVSTNKEVLDYIVETARNSIPDFDVRKTLTSFSGIRATSDRHDFIIEESAVKGFINVAGIESPGLTSSPAIAKYVIEILKNMAVALIENPKFNPHRNPIIIQKDETFQGDIHATSPDEHIICRCEKVTEKEIVDALTRGIGVNSIDSVKRRTRAGMGPCQGNFCAKRVAEIIAKTKGIDVEAVPKRGGALPSSRPEKIEHFGEPRRFQYNNSTIRRCNTH